MRLNLSVTRQSGYIHGAKVSYRLGTKVPNLTNVQQNRAISELKTMFRRRARQSQ